MKQCELDLKLPRRLYVQEVSRDRAAKRILNEIMAGMAYVDPIFAHCNCPIPVRGEVGKKKGGY